MASPARGKPGAENPWKVDGVDPHRVAGDNEGRANLAAALNPQADHPISARVRFDRMSRVGHEIDEDCNHSVAIRHERREDGEKIGAHPCPAKTTRPQTTVAGNKTPKAKRKFPQHPGGADE